MYTVYTFSMQTKIIFNADIRLKRAVATKARAQGMTLSAVFNLAAQAYIDNRLHIEAIDERLAKSRDEVQAGQVYSATLVRKILKLS